MMVVVNVYHTESVVPPGCDNPKHFMYFAPFLFRQLPRLHLLPKQLLDCSRNNDTPPNSPGRGSTLLLYDHTTTIINRRCSAANLAAAASVATVVAVTIRLRNMRLPR